MTMKYLTFVLVLLLTSPAWAGDAVLAHTFTKVNQPGEASTKGCEGQLLSRSTCSFLFGNSTGPVGFEDDGTTAALYISNPAGALVCLQPDLALDNTNPTPVLVDVNYSPLFGATTDEDRLVIGEFENLDGSNCVVVFPGTVWMDYDGTAAIASRLTITARY